jgi:hypothetical protein
MTTINSSGSDYTNIVQTALKRNTAIEVINAKQSGTSVNKEEIQLSNQEIKDKSVNAGFAIYQAKLQKNTMDTYLQSSEQAKDIYSSSSSDSSNTPSTPSSTNPEIYTFDAQAVNEARSTVHKRAIGISVYENVQGANIRN